MFTENYFGVQIDIQVQTQKRDTNSMKFRDITLM